METIKTKKSINRFRVKIITLALFMFLLWALLTIYGQMIDVNVIENELKVLKDEQEEVILCNEQLKHEVQQLQNEDYIAKLAREYYFLSKPGEILLISPNN